LVDSPELWKLGFSQRWQTLFAPHEAAGLTPARVVRGDRGSALIATAPGVVRAKNSTRLSKAAAGAADLPVVGDWVAVLARADLEAPLIEAVLERAGAIARGDPGKPSDLQVLAANIDTVFVVHPIAEAPNLRRIERELALAWGAGSVPVIVITKADLSADPDGAHAAVKAIAFGVDVLLTSAVTGQGVEPLGEYLSGHRTGVLVGPSGAGKSSLVNALLGQERQPTREVRLSDGRGRHTTVARELIQLPSGGMVIDTPGLRALGLTGSEQGIATAFPDVEEIALSCRFGDCTHRGEPGCAVAIAVDSGSLPAERVVSYHKLLREAQVAAMRTDGRLRSEENRKWKIIHKAVKDHYRRSGKG
jgi:ribosome biogenesis GTPase / thiamine phosphate phosphatase